LSNRRHRPSMDTATTRDGTTRPASSAVTIRPASVGGGTKNRTMPPERVGLTAPSPAAATPGHRAPPPGLIRRGRRTGSSAVVGDGDGGGRAVAVLGDDQVGFPRAWVVGLPGVRAVHQDSPCPRPVQATRTPAGLTASAVCRCAAPGHRLSWEIAITGTSSSLASNFICRENSLTSCWPGLHPLPRRHQLQVVHHDQLQNRCAA